MKKTYEKIYRNTYENKKNSKIKIFIYTQLRLS